MTAIVAGAVLRFAALGRPALWLDEILHYDVAERAIAQPWWKWLTVFAIENGPIYYASILAGRFSDDVEFAGRFAFAIVGTLGVLAAWWAGKARGELVAAILVVLTAVSPLHVYYSRDARPYALLVVETTVLIALLFRARYFGALLAVLGTMLYTAAVAAPVIASAAALSALLWLCDRRGPNARFDLRAAIACSAAAAAIPLLYTNRPGIAAAAPFPEISLEFTAMLLQSFSVVAIENVPASPVAWLAAALALIGATSLLRTSRRAGAIAVGMFFGPLVISLFTLSWMGHWYSVRYVIGALPAWLLLVACGIAVVASVLGRLFPGRGITAAVATALTLVIAASGLDAALREPYRKLDWGGIASTVWHRAGAGDLVMATNEWSRVCLEFYLRRLPPKVMLVTAGDELARAEHAAATYSPVWIVEAGFHSDPAMTEWSCRFPKLLWSDLESFRLHVAPSLAALDERPARSSLTQASSARGASVELGPEDAQFLRGAWFEAEAAGSGFVRWSGRDASVRLPAIGRRIVFRVMPMDVPGAPPQSVRVVLNGTDVATRALPSGWSDVVIDIPPDVQRNVVDDVRFVFSHATTPISVDPSLNDSRELSAQFDFIATTSGEVPVAELPPVSSMLLRLEPADASGRALIFEKAMSPPFVLTRRRPRTDAEQVQAMLARMGYTPDVVNAVRRGEVHLEDFTASVAGIGCLSDQAFAARVPELLFGAPDAGVAARVTSMLERGYSRKAVVEEVLFE